MSIAIDLAGRVILVCGAARGGISGATVRRVAQAGATVVDGFHRLRRTFQQDLDRGKDRPIVIDDENARHGFP